MIAVTVRVWSMLTAWFGLETSGSRRLEVQVPDGATLLDLLRQLGAEYPRFGSVMFDAGGEPSDQVSVVLNGRLPELGEGLATRLRDGDQVTLVQAYAGGAPPVGMGSHQGNRSARSDPRHRQPI